MFVLGQTISENRRTIFKKRHPNIEKISRENIECVLQILAKFGINAYDACLDPHVFSMNPISMDNYGEILKECCFSKIIPKYIIRYREKITYHSNLKHVPVFVDSFFLTNQWVIIKFDLGKVCGLECNSPYTFEI